MIKAIIFDYGNVVARFDNRLLLQNILPFSGKSREELEAQVYHSTDLHIQYETGLITSDEFFAQIKEIADLDISKQDFIAQFCDIFTPIHSTHGLIKSLKSTYKLGLLSNTNEWHFDHAIKKSPVYPAFDAVSLSFQVKAMKPDPKIYLDMAAKLSLPPNQCVYIDDIQKNVDGANTLGFHALLYTNHQILLTDLHPLTTTT